MMIKKEAGLGAFTLLVLLFLLTHFDINIVYIGAGTITVGGSLNVQNNKATSGGGGFCMDGSGQVTGAGKTVISGNTAANGGGIYMITYSSATGNDRFEPTGIVEITGNKATSNGGGIFITGGNGTRRVTLQHALAKNCGQVCHALGVCWILARSAPCASPCISTFSLLMCLAFASIADRTKSLS